MRLGMWATAAAAMLCAGQAEAATFILTQNVNSSFAPHGSRGAAPIGGLNLSGGLAILSATLNYSYSGETYQGFYNPGTDPVTFQYGGTAGFAVFNLPVPFYASTSVSGDTPCAARSCSASVSGSGTMDVPLADLAAFAGPRSLLFSAQGGFSGTIDQPGLPLTDNGYSSSALGTITYIISDGALPEPASWAMMIVGIGLVGAALRRTKSRARAVAI